MSRGSLLEVLYKKMRMMVGDITSNTLMRAWGFKNTVKMKHSSFKDECNLLHATCNKNACLGICGISVVTKVSNDKLEKNKHSLGKFLVLGIMTGKKGVNIKGKKLN